jgi:hypothetical protein
MACYDSHSFGKELVRFYAAAFSFRQYAPLRWLLTPFFRIAADDKDIAVVLPNNNTISFQSPFDQDSGCRLERDTQPVLERGNYVENIYCPPGSSPPLGSYMYTARNGQELWTLEVYVDGKLASSENGSGDSPDLVFEL